MTSAIQSTLWLARRYDMYINRSVLTLKNPDYYQDPYPTYAALRARGPILRSAANRGWVVFGYKEVKDLLVDKRIGSDIRKSAFLSRVVRYAVGDLELPIIDNPPMLNMDPPDHSRLRRLVAQGFLNKYIQSLAPKIDQLIDDLLAEIPQDATAFDLIDTLARPLPAIVIAEMMGVPVSERHYFEKWSEQLIGVSEIRNPELIHLAAKGNVAMRDYLAALTAKKRQAPGQDLISQLIAAEEDGDRLSLDELYSTCVLLLVAGHETTTRLIGNTMFHLLNHPAQLAAVRADPVLIDNLIEETLRFDSPVQMLIRLVNEPFSYEGHQFNKDQIVVLALGAANRDLVANPNPEQFDIHRENISHISFGHGIHMCLGMSLARLETRLAIEKLLVRFPNCRIAAGKPEWGTNDFFRGLRHLKLEV